MGQFSYSAGVCSNEDCIIHVIIKRKCTDLVTNLIPYDVISSMLFIIVLWILVGR